MTSTRSGILAMIGAATVWGLSPLYYRELTHIAPLHILAHRALWSLVFFAGLLAVQGRLREMRAAFTGWRRTAVIAIAALMISTNWFLFILGVQIHRTTETSLGYYIFPLVAVLLGRFAFGERLDRAQGLAVGLAAAGVVVLTFGLGVPPWISLVLATTFGLYGVIKKELPLGPVVSVTCEILIFAPVALILLALVPGPAEGGFGVSPKDTVLLLLSGPITALPLILFSVAARRIAMSTIGLLQYINPTLQFLCAVALFGEPFTIWHSVAFGLIWAALAIYSLALVRQDRASRRVIIASEGVSTIVRNPASDGSANP